MTPERYGRISELYHQVLARPVEQRAPWLAKACGDDTALREEVMSLLAAHDAAAGFIEMPAIETAAAALAEDHRPIAVGARIGPYEVRGLLGRGGMGEVYRAHDPRVGRDVAVKLLPERFTHDRQRPGRFEREARLLAALNHPNVAALYGIEESHGQWALVLELVEGPTLAERLTGGPIPVPEALGLAVQLAEALDAAHEHGIIHRDLKPANITIRPDGTVKVLDFGLARALDAPAGTEAAAGSMAFSDDGAVVGTTPYMSPEQARGARVDQRTDIWAFGCVLYEMLTGRRAFDGDTRSDVVAAVINGTPDWDVLPADTPPLVRRVLHRCLEQDPKRRLRHIGDARSDLEEALSPSIDDTSSIPVPSADVRLRNRRRVAALVTAAFAVGAVAGALVLWRRPGPPRVVRTIIAADTFLASTDRNFAFTPDGRALAYISSDARRMFVRPLKALEPTPILTTSTFIRGVFPSPDSRWFAYVENNFDLKKVPATGEPPSTLLTMDGPSRGVAWGPDDTIVFATGAPETGLQRVAAHGGSVTILTRPDRQGGERDHVNPVWLPGGRSVLFTILRAKGGLDAAKVAVLDLPSGTWHAVLEGGFGARYVDGGSGGYLVYAANDALWAQGFDLGRLVTQGAAWQVLRPVSVGSMGGMAEFDIASDGALAYSRGAISQSRRLPVWVDRSGRETPLPVRHDNYTHPRFSPDATRLAIVANGHIFVWDWKRPWSTATRLTFEPTIDWYPVWTPDSRRILFGSWRGGGFSNLYAYDLETASTVRLTDSPDMQLPTSITPDGTTVIFHRFARSIQAVRLEAGAEPVTLVDTPADERNGEISPDGRWLAYEGESPFRRGELDVYVRSFSDVNRGVWQVSEGGGLYPVWSRSGRELFYVTLDGKMVSVPVEASGTTWKAGSPTTLFHQRYDIREGSLGRIFDVAPDGRFLMMKNESNVDAAHIVLVQDWVAELARHDR